MVFLCACFSEACVQPILNVVFRSLCSAYIGDYCKWFSEACVQNNLNVVFRESDVGGFT